MTGEVTLTSRDVPSRTDAVLRAELAREFGFYPASVKPEDVERTRAQLAEHDRWHARAQASSLTGEQLTHRYAHLSDRRERKQ